MMKNTEQFINSPVENIATKIEAEKQELNMDDLNVVHGGRKFYNEKLPNCVSLFRKAVEASDDTAVLIGENNIFDTIGSIEINPILTLPEEENQEN